MNKIKILLSLLVLIFYTGFHNVIATPEGIKDFEKDVRQIIKRVSPNVVRVESENGARRVATGIILDKNGYLITTALVASKGRELKVKTIDGKKFRAKLIGIDFETHLAVLKIEAENFKSLEFGSKKDLFPGAWIGVISLSPELLPAITQGIINSVSRRYLRINAWITPGTSGSPVVNREGKIIGIVRGIYSEEKPIIFEFREREVVGTGYVFSKAEAPSSGMALAIPIGRVRKVLKEIKEKGKVERGWLGVSIRRNSIGEVEIVYVEKDSPAYEAGLEIGDVILKINGEKVISTSFLASEIREKKPGEKIVLEIKRDSKIKKIEVKLGELPERKYPRLHLRHEKFPEIESFRPKFEKRFRFYWKSKKYIGIYVQECTEELAKYFGVEEGKGLLVTKVMKNSPAEKAGIKVGDVLIKADNELLDSTNKLTSIIRKKNAGDILRIELIRDKKRKIIEVKIEKREYKGVFDWDEFEEEMDRLRKELKKFELTYGKQLKEYKEVLNKYLKEYQKRAKEIAEKSWKKIRNSGAEKIFI
jgi:S1-C subfamily serine protease